MVGVSEPKLNMLTDPILGSRTCLTLVGWEGLLAQQGRAGLAGQAKCWSCWGGTCAGQSLPQSRQVGSLPPLPRFSLSLILCPRCGQELGSTQPALIIPHSVPVEGVMLPFAFQNLYLPASSLNKSQLHLCPKPQVACLSEDFYPV